MLLQLTKWANKKNPNANRGKYQKKRFAAATPVKQITEISITENRVINLENLKFHLQEVTHHVATCQSCQDKALQNENAIILFGELTRAGLASILSSRCAGCLQEFRFSTSSKVQGMTGGKCWETNLAAVWGQMCTGGGHTPLAETMAVLGVQTMSKQSFMSTERMICEWWRDLLSTP